MSNPIFSSFNSFENQNNSNSLFDVYNQVRQSKNPDQVMQRLLANTPQYQEIMKYIDQNGGDAKTAFYNMAAQKELILKPFYQDYDDKRRP